MKVSIRKTDIYVFVMAAIYILSQNILYLVPVNRIYSWCAYVIILVFAGYVLCVVNKMKLPNNVFTFLMLAPMFLSAMASLVEFILFNDASIITSFYKQMQWWIYGLVYFVFSFIMERDNRAFQKIIRCFVIIGIVQVIIGITQYIFSTTTIFTYALTNKRLGLIRFYFPIVLMVFVYFWALTLFLNKKRKMLAIILMVAILFETAFVQQFRSTLLCMVVATIVGLMLWRNIFYKKIGIFLVIGLGVYIFYLNSSFLQMSLEYMLRGDKSLNVRHYLIDFILDNAKTKWLFGSGWVSSSTAYEYASTPYKTNINWGVFAFADGGIFSILYSYGLFGVLWVVALWYTLLKNGWKIFKSRNNYLYLLFPLYMLLPMYIDIHWYIHDQFFVMALFCALLNYEIKHDKGVD